MADINELPMWYLDEFKRLIQNTGRIPLKLAILKKNTAQKIEAGSLPFRWH